MRRYADIARPLDSRTTGDKLTVALAWLAGIIVVGIPVGMVLALISRTA